jgi:4-hydroxy-tetrahydrodipicolinate synthase
MNLQGCGTALVTPFHPDGSLDEETLRTHVDWQIANGITLLVPAGTTGEASTLTEAELLRVVEITIAASAGHAKVFAGCTHNNTRQAVANAEKLSRIAGLDGLLTANPYYNKPNQEGQYQHFRAIAEATSLPIMLYNIPGRTGANLEPATVLRLAELSNIVAIKESSGNLAQITELIIHAPLDFKIFSGDDAFGLATLALGAAGLISVASNALPQQISQMVSSALANDFTTAAHLHRTHFAFIQACFLEPSPAPIKAALALLGRGNETLRLPMVPVGAVTRQTLQSLLSTLTA